MAEVQLKKNSLTDGVKLALLECAQRDKLNVHKDTRQKHF